MKRPLFIFGIFTLIWTVVFLLFFETKACYCFAFSFACYFSFRFIFKNKKTAMIFLSAVVSSGAILLNSFEAFPKEFFNFDRINMSATVFDVRETEKGGILSLYGKAREKDGKEKNITARVFVKTDNLPQKGEKIRLSFKVDETCLENKKLRARGIDFSGQAISYSKTGEKNAFLFQIGKAKEGLKSALIKNVGAKEGGFALSVFSGDKSLLPKEIESQFKALGCSHIFSVSGIHMGAVFLVVGAISYFSCISGFSRFFIRVFSIFLYSLFASGGFSIVRAGLIYFLIALSELLRRRYDGKSALGFCGLVLVTANPYVVFDTGFMLSFWIVFGINIFYFPIYHKILFVFDKMEFRLHYEIKKDSREEKIKKNLIGAISVSICAFASSAILTLFYFKKLYVYSLISSAFVSVAVAGIIYLIPLFALESLVFRTHIFSFLIKKIASITFEIIKAISKLPFKEIYVSSWVYVAIGLILAFSYFANKSLNKKRKAPVLAICFSLVLVLGAGSAFLSQNYYKLKVFENTAVLVGDEGAYLIGSYDSHNEGEKIEEFLKSQGIKGISLQIVDKGHSESSEANFYLLQKSLVKKIAYKNLNPKYEENLREKFPKLKLQKLTKNALVIKENGKSLFSFYKSEKHKCNFLKIGSVTLLKPIKNCDIILDIKGERENLPFEQIERILKHISNGCPSLEGSCKICQKGREILKISDGAFKGAIAIKSGAYKSVFEKDLVYIKNN